MKKVEIITNNPTDKKKYDNKTLTYTEMKTHRKNIYNVLNEIGWYINETGTLHDWTKESFFDEYYKDTIERKTGTNWKDREWYKIHTKYERHHINSNKPIDVNLIDIIEMITDCICTAKQNNTKIETEYLQIPLETLIEAYWNTIKLIEDNTYTNPQKTGR